MIDYLQKWCCLIVFIKGKDGVKVIQPGNIDLNCSRHLYFMDHEAAQVDILKGNDKLFIVEDNDAGVVMSRAVQYAFNEGYRKVVIIADKNPLPGSIIEEAFNCLKMLEFCVGPTGDGGYYLLGMNYWEPSLFNNKMWQSPGVYKETLKDIGNLKLALYRFPVLQNIRLDVLISNR